jgi:hypothetical protein
MRNASDKRYLSDISRNKNGLKKEMYNAVTFYTLLYNTSVEEFKEIQKWLKLNGTSQLTSVLVTILYWMEAHLP